MEITSTQEYQKERAELQKLVLKPLPENLNDIGMDYFTASDFNELVEFVDLLLTVKHRIQNEELARNEVGWRNQKSKRKTCTKRLCFKRKKKTNSQEQASLPVNKWFLKQGFE